MALKLGLGNLSKGDGMSLHRSWDEAAPLFEGCH